MIDFLHDHRWALVYVTVAVLIWLFTAIKRNGVLAGAGGAGSMTGVNRQPVAGRKDIVPQQRTSTGGLAPSIEAGVAEHTHRGSAATAKLLTPVDEKRRPTEALKTVKPPPLPTPEQLRAADKALPRSTTTGSGDAAVDDEAMQGLFAGLKGGDPEKARTDTDTLAPTGEQGGPGTRAIRKANRLEEIGFHHQIESDQLPAQAPAAPGTTKPATTTTEKPAAPAPAAQVPAPATPTAPAQPAKPRTQTAELDDILKRIDKVLAENPAPADKPATAAIPAPPAPAPKPPERLDPSDVLKRIDQALAESQRPNSSAEVTMLDPDWEDDAKSHAPEAPPAPPKPATGATAKPDTQADTKSEDDVPDWAKQDAEDDKDTKSDDGKGGGGPSQQKLF